jgi:aspartate/methionine/tyrosine aminotransferase
MAITAKAAELRAQGRPVIGYGAGEPDFPTPDYIVEAALAAARDERWHHYTAAAGLPQLKEAVAAKTLRDSGIEIDPAHVVVTNGGKHAVYATCQALVDPGDEVLLPAPYWVSYPETIKLAGGIPVEIPTDETTNFQVTVDQLEAARTDRTKMLVFVSPSNPTGSVYRADAIAAIGAWAAEHGIWVMTDEIYEHLVYGDTSFASMPAVAPEAADRTVIVNGVAKSYAMTGWRVGWMIAPPAVARAGMKLQSHMTSNVNNIAQIAAAAALNGPLDAVHEMRDAFDRRRRKMYDLLSGIEGVVCPEPQGAFYAFPSLQGLLGRPLNGREANTSLDLAALLLDEIEIAIVPGEAFGAPGYARFSFAMSDDDMVEGLTRLADLVAAG